MLSSKESEDILQDVRAAVEVCKEHNVCGECQACCWLFTIAQMQKPRMTKCRHQCEAGCAIHGQERPPNCTNFQCEWLRENWAPELRPDRSRILWQGLGMMPDRWGRPHRVWLGHLLDRSAYLRRVNDRWCDRLVARNEIVCLQHIDPDPEVEKMQMRRCSQRAFPGLGTREIVRHIRAITLACDGENVARQQAFDRELKGAKARPSTMP